MTLLHVCCGPCGIYPARVLKENKKPFEAYFYNPNIHPEEEFEKRLNTAVEWAEKESIILRVSSEQYQDPWVRQGLLKEDRCALCYEIRIKNVFLYAKEQSFNSVTSTLLVSPYQNHALIVDIFKAYSEKTRISFLYYDFRKGFRWGQEQARNIGLYRQKYCGCLPSLNESAAYRRNKGKNDRQNA